MFELKAVRVYVSLWRLLEGLRYARGDVVGIATLFSKSCGIVSECVSE